MENQKFDPTFIVDSESVINVRSSRSWGHHHIGIPKPLEPPGPPELLDAPAPPPTIKPKDYELILKYNGAIKELLATYDIKLEVLTNQFAIIESSNIGTIEEIALKNEIICFESSKDLAFTIDDSSKRSACINKAINPPYNFSGKGVIIGIIDYGINYRHKDFIKGEETRILSIWDQNESSGEPPEGFLTGSEYTQTQINQALQSTDNDIVPTKDSSLVGHGTHIASIAGTIAKDSEFIIVKLGTGKDVAISTTTNVMRAIKYIIDKAKLFNRPVAINLSIGNNYGAHNGSSMFEAYIDEMATHWKTSIVVGAGNEAADAHHTSGLLEKDNTIKTIELQIAQKEQRIKIQIWKSYLDDIEIEIKSPNLETSGFITKKLLQTQTFTLSNTYIKIYVDMPTPLNKLQQIYIELNTIYDEIMPGLWLINLKVNKIVLGTYDIWLPRVEEISEDTKFLSPIRDMTLTVPGTASKVITVGGYDIQSENVPLDSGRGKEGDIDKLKPDLVAPSINILGALSTSNDNYHSLSGTSIATPFVTGAVALLMEWGIVQGNDPFLYGEKIKTYLQKSALRFDNIAYPNSTWGYGILCLDNILPELEIFKPI